MKKFFKKTTILLLSFFIMPLSIFAYSDSIIPGGQNIGIELHTNGILVVGFYEVNGKKLEQTSKLKVGDQITSIENTKVHTIEEMGNEILKHKDQTELSITYERNGKVKTTVLPIEYGENQVLKTGLYVKDSITGIGTLTYIDPNTKLFGALGHEILEKMTGKPLEMKDGKIFHSEITSITKSDVGNPGQKNAKFYFEEVEGSVLENTEKGIFGTYEETLPERKTYQVGKPKLGKAYIQTVLNGSEIGTYEIEIEEINEDRSTKNLVFRITDPKLLNQTGGIVQGMSGSPILQGDYIVGAVTHVIVDSPKKGYGILITHMLEEAEN